MADDQVQQVKEAVDIVAVIGERVQLTKAGRNFKGLCPFHGEKTPSFFVSEEMQNFKCFGCGVGGDVISFVEMFEGLNFGEALEVLAKRAGIELVKRGGGGKKQLEEELRECLSLAQEYFHYLLLEHKVGEGARGYLNKRGVPRIFWKDYKLGYAANNWDGLLKYLVKKKKIEPSVLEKAGLVIRGTRGRYYDRFRGRVIYPQFDFAGHVVGFAGRTLNEHEKEAKYINSPETPVYHKGKILYGLYQNKRSIKEADRVIVVEGEMDMLSSVKAGVKEVVAVKGSALTNEQVLLIRRLTKNIVLALDADEAGQKAMQRAIEVAQDQAMQLRVLRVAEGKDPDEIVQKSPKRWREMSKETVSIYQYYIDWVFSQDDPDTGEGKKVISQQLAGMLAKIENAAERLFYLKKIAERLEVTERVMEEEVAKVARGVKEKTGEIETEEMPLTRREKLERYVLSLGFNLGTALGRELVKLSSEWFEEDYLRKLVEKAIAVIEKRELKTMGEVKKYLDQTQMALVDELYAQQEDILVSDQEEIREMYERARGDLEAMWRREEIKRINLEMSQYEEGDERLESLREKLARL